jgi:hypothetical protein
MKTNGVKLSNSSEVNWATIRCLGAIVYIEIWVVSCSDCYRPLWFAFCLEIYGIRNSNNFNKNVGMLYTILECIISSFNIVIYKKMPSYVYNMIFITDLSVIADINVL